MNTGHFVDATLFDHALRFESNNCRVLESAEQFITEYASHMGCGEAPLTIRIIVQEGDERVAETPIKYLSGDDGRLFLHSSDVLGVVEPLRRESTAYVSARLAEHPDFRQMVLEAITLALVACFDRHPLHAAAIVHGERALLLAGVSGAGKSTLAHVGMQAGFGVLAEDRVWVQLAPSLRVWGAVTHIRAREQFGERRVIPIQPESTISSVENVTVCVLARDSEARLELMTQGEVLSALEAQLAPGFDRFPERFPLVARALSPHGGWRLALSDNPDDALPFLRIMLEEGHR